MSRLILMDVAAGTPVASTGTETSMARLTLTTTLLRVGTILEWDFLSRSTATVGTDTLQVRVRFGTNATVTSNTAVATSAAVDQVNNDVCICRGRLHLQTSTRWIFTVTMSDPDAEGGPALAYSEIFVGTAATHYLDITADWSTTNANSVQSEAWAVWEVR